MKTLAVLFVLSFGSVAAAEWTKISEPNQKTYSEEWKLSSSDTGSKACYVKVFTDGTGVDVEAMDLFVPLTPPGGDGPTLYHVGQHLVITETSKGINMSVEWGGGGPFSDGHGFKFMPDIFFSECRDAAQSLPSNVREKFHHLYGIEP